MNSSPPPPYTELIWKGSPSAAIHTWLYFSCILLFPLPWALFRCYQTRHTDYELYPDRLYVKRRYGQQLTQGVLLKQVDTITVSQPRTLGWLSLSEVVLTTCDERLPALRLRGIVDADFLQALLLRQRGKMLST